MIASEIGSSVGRTARASIVTLNPRDNFVPNSILGCGHPAMREYMRTKDLQASEEKRAYFRLLRHLVGNELPASDTEDQARPLQHRIADFLKELEHYEPSKIH